MQTNRWGEEGVSEEAAKTARSWHRPEEPPMTGNNTPEQEARRWKAIGGGIVRSSVNGDAGGAEDEFRIGAMAKWFADYLNALEATAARVEALERELGRSVEQASYYNQLSAEYYDHVEALEQALRMIGAAKWYRDTPDGRKVQEWAADALNQGTTEEDVNLFS